MDAWGMGIMAFGIVGYFVTNKKPGFLLMVGVGAGIIIGAFWAMSIVSQVFSGL